MPNRPKGNPVDPRRDLRLLKNATTPSCTSQARRHSPRHSDDTSRDTPHGTREGVSCLRRSAVTSNSSIMQCSYTSPSTAERAPWPALHAWAPPARTRAYLTY